MPPDEIIKATPALPEVQTSEDPGIVSVDPVHIGKTIIFRNENVERKTTEVQHLTPTTATAYMKMYEHQYATPAQEETKREVQRTAQVRYQAIAETVRGIVPAIVTGVCVVGGLYVVLRNSATGGAVVGIVGVMAAFGVANNLVNKLVKPKVPPKTPEHRQLGGKSDKEE